MAKLPQQCNILDPAEGRLWRFARSGRAVELEDETVGPWPLGQVQKSWANAWRPKANVAWLPGSEAYLRVLQMPASDPAELRAMLEFQIEKQSPLPAAQIIWAMETLPSAAPETVTIVLLIVPRSHVEHHLAQLEQKQFFPDRLEIPTVAPFLRPEAPGQPPPEGIWVEPNPPGAPQTCLVAWWFRGALQNLQQIHLPAGGGPEHIQEQLVQTAWAGEVEGWLQQPVKTHLIADPDMAAAWTPALAQWSGSEPVIHPPASRLDLARESAERAVRGDSSGNLLPPENAVRYRQQQIDRLWMKGLGAVMAVYLLGLLIYFGALQVLGFRSHRLEAQTQSLAGSYTNALQLKERVQVLEDQLNLKYAALDCWKSASELLPAELTLTWLIFGKSGNVQGLTLQGTAPAEDAGKLTDYNEAMRNAIAHEQPLFSKVTLPNSSTRPGPNNTTVLSWQFQCELNKLDIE